MWAREREEEEGGRARKRAGGGRGRTLIRGGRKEQCGWNVTMVM